MIGSYFFWLGTINLIFLCLEERNLFKNLLFADKKNYFMLGVAFSLVTHYITSLWFILGIIIFSVTIGIALKMLNMNNITIGAVNWVILGSSIVLFVFPLAYLILFGLFILLAYFIKKLSKSDKNIPFIYLLTFSFIIINLIARVY